MTSLTILAILLNEPVLREVIVFGFLSFIPGFAVLKLFKLKQISIVDTIIFSVGLSIALIMFIGLLVNQLSLLVGFSNPLSTMPLTLAISAFTIAVFFIAFMRDSKEHLNPQTMDETGNKPVVFALQASDEGPTKPKAPGLQNNVNEIDEGEKDSEPPKYELLTSIVLVLLPILSIFSVLYAYTPLILLSYAIIAALAVLSVVSRRLIPASLFPFLIFSISIALVCQLPLTSKYILGYDSNLEYYVFRITQINGHWGFLAANVNPLTTLTYNSMLSITVLPAAYSVLMHAQGEIIFKVLYPFIFSLVPLVIYRICEKQFGKLIGLLSVFFFVFTSAAFYSEPLSLNRQIVGEFFLILSIFLLLNKTLPTTKTRLLLIIFGAGLAVSHYSVAYIYLAIIAVIFIVSKVRPKFNGTLDSITVLVLFGITLSWYAITSAPLIALYDALKGIYVAITTGAAVSSGTATSLIFIPQTFTAATWINLILSGLAELFLIIGVLLIVVRPKGTGISPQYSVMVLFAAIILATAYFVPSFSATLIFPRFYGILLLFLAPCFVLGGQVLLVTISRAFKKMKQHLTHRIILKNIKTNVIFLLIAVILGAYFLSQAGFVNNVTNSAIHSYTIDFNRSKASIDPAVELNFYSIYTPEQDVFSAVWLLNHQGPSILTYSDYESGIHVLTSYGLTPWKMLGQITNSTVPLPDTYVYLSRLNVADNIVTTYSTTFKTSEVYPNLSRCSLVYSNGDGEIWWCPASG
jgi:uncharacterized membrane protein